MNMSVENGPKSKDKGEIINARRACARGLQYSVCLFVCLSVTSLLLSLRVHRTNYVHLHACSLLDFLGFQLSEFDETNGR